MNMMKCLIHTRNQYSTLPSINEHHSVFSSSSWVSSSWELALHANMTVATVYKYKRQI